MYLYVLSLSIYIYNVLLNYLLALINYRAMVDISISNGNYEHVKCTENASYMISSNTMSTQLTVGNDVKQGCLLRLV